MKMPTVVCIYVCLYTNILFLTQYISHCYGQEACIQQVDLIQLFHALHSQNILFLYSLRFKNRQEADNNT